MVEIKIKDAEEDSLVLYEKGKPADYFMMVVQGHVNVTVGREGFTFSQGAFSYFCQDVLLPNNSDYVPDYNVKVTSDALLIKVTTDIYKQALLSTKLKNWETDDEEVKLSLSDNQGSSDFYDANSVESFDVETAAASPMLDKTRNEADG